jgi:hypothetical protein
MMNEGLSMVPPIDDAKAGRQMTTARHRITTAALPASPIGSI